MAYDVSSWFQGRTQVKNPDNLVRKFTIGTSDYSTFVTKWPTVRKAWNDIRPRNMTINLSNEDQTFNFFRTNKTEMRQDCSIEFGYSSGPNLLPWSEQFDTGWTNNGVTMLQNLIGADDVSSSGWTVTDDSALASENFQYIIPVNDDSRYYVGSIKVKKDSDLSRYPVFQTWLRNGSSEVKCQYSLNTQTGSLQEFGTTGTVLSGVIDESDNYWRFWGAALNNNTGNDDFLIRFFPAGAKVMGAFDVTAVGSCGVDAAQMEVGDYPSLYAVNVSSATGAQTDELITIFSGKTEKISYNKGGASVILVDKFEQLSNRVVGTSEQPLMYTGSNYLPSDIAWWLVTSYGAYSTIESTSNPDINYTDFLEWASVFSEGSILVNAEFTGQKVIECLKKIGRITNSAIYEADGKISFKRFGIADTNVTSIDNSVIEDLKLSFDIDRVVNKQYAYGMYDPTSDQWGLAVFDESSISVDSYGLREQVEKDENVWYVNSVSALDFAQRMTNQYDDPFDIIELTTYLPAVLRVVGETMSVVDSFHGVSQGFRIMGTELNLDNGVTRFDLDRSQFKAAFTLDVSSLDGEDVLT